MIFYLPKSCTWQDKGLFLCLCRVEPTATATAEAEAEAEVVAEVEAVAVMCSHCALIDSARLMTRREGDAPIAVHNGELIGRKGLIENILIEVRVNMGCLDMDSDSILNHINQNLDTK